MGSDHRAIYTGEIKKKERIKERERKERRLCIVLQRYYIEDGRGWRRKGRVGMKREGKENRKDKKRKDERREKKRKDTMGFYRQLSLSIFHQF